MSKQMSNFFQYGEKEIEYLKKADKRLCKVIEQVGFIEKKLRPDLFTALVHSIIGQQISMKAQRTVYEKMQQGLGGIGEWTAEMLMIFTLQRPDVLSFKDLAILKNKLKHGKKFQKIRPRE